ncbi:ROK family transcriptional regulator [Spelaeicoccus albus]|uniref:ROK family transcriptional regulator n=1 Tax=Spelaeicoccus albus TaxID=1280376 RepID=UPI0015CD21D7|nr:ROK family transcriptional regulator [Spelaeicoccus albus]
MTVLSSRSAVPHGPRISTLATKILRLVSSGVVTTRTELADELAAPPSTISSAVGQLVELGLVVEHGQQSSTGGRPRKVLRLGRKDDFAIAADIGAHHARIGVVLPGGRLEHVENVKFSIDEGPETGLDRLSTAFARLAEAQGAENWRAVGLSMPGPVDTGSGTVELPSRMPGWNRFPIVSWLQDKLARPVVVDNDANCMAFAEQLVQPNTHRRTVLVKAGSAIGAGIVIDGELYRGANGVAGDITHVRVDAAGDTPCSCGNTGCLETIASGLALVRIVSEQGVPVTSVQDVVQLAIEANPIATRAVRRAGAYLGEVLAANVNFFNPDGVYLGGYLATLEAFVAAVRSQLYDDCHPLVTRHLSISRAKLGENGGITGAGVSALQAAVVDSLEALSS